LRIFERELQFLGERLDRRAPALPLPFGLEPQVADAAAPGCDDAADGAKVGALGVLLIEATDDVGRHADERAQRGRRTDAVLAPVPRTVEDEGNLLEVVDEEFLGFLVRIGRPAAAEDVSGKQLLQLLRERRLS